MYIPCPFPVFLRSRFLRSTRTLAARRRPFLVFLPSCHTSRAPPPSIHPLTAVTAIARRPGSFSFNFIFAPKVRPANEFSERTVFFSPRFPFSSLYPRLTTFASSPPWFRAPVAIQTKIISDDFCATRTHAKQTSASTAFKSYLFTFITYNFSFCSHSLNNIWTSARKSLGRNLTKDTLRTDAQTTSGTENRLFLGRPLDVLVARQSERTPPKNHTRSLSQHFLIFLMRKIVSIHSLFRRNSRFMSIMHGFFYSTFCNGLICDEISNNNNLRVYPFQH